MNSELLRERIRDLTYPISPQKVNHKTKLQTLEDIRCVAFDFYGTMFISGVGDIGIDGDQQQNSIYFTEALKSTGFSIINENAGKKGVILFEKMIKENIEGAKNRGIDYPEPDVYSIWLDVLRKLMQDKFISGDLNEHSAAHFGVEFEFRINKIWPVPNLANLLNSLLEHDIILGIISNSQFYTPIAFEVFLGKSPEQFGFHPDLLIWSFELGRKKPSQQLYQQFGDTAKNEEDIYPHEILYVGNDIRKDIYPAKSQNLKTALYVGDKRSIRHTPEELKKDKYQPNLIIDDLHQIPDCLPL